MRIAVLDIGGTVIKSGIWDGNKLTFFDESRTRASEGGAALMQSVAGILQDLRPFDAIGVATAGQVDAEKGRIVYANPNLPDYTGMNVRRILEEEFGVPVTVENDVNAAAVGEMYFGAAVGESDFLCLTYGTGVGGAIVMNGRIRHGSHWSAGYFGGILTHAGWNLRGCTAEEMQTPEGSYEANASVMALVRRAKEVDASLTDGRKIFDAFASVKVRDVIDAWIDEVVYGLLSLIHIFDPPLVVLGGGILEQPYVIEQVNTRTIDMLEPGFREVRIVEAQLGNTAGLMGAAILAGRRFMGKEVSAK